MSVCHVCRHSLSSIGKRNALSFPDGAYAFCSEDCMLTHVHSCPPIPNEYLPSYGISPAPKEWKDAECYSTLLDQRFRSWFECSVAEHLVLKWKTPIVFEPHSIRLDRTHCYVPDFWLPEYGVWLEVKGEWRLGAKSKFTRTQEILGADRLLIVPPAYKWLTEKRCKR